MAYITEKSAFDGNDVPLLETSTPIKGYDGTSIGPANEQAQILANRTLWLKNEAEATYKTVASLSEKADKVALAQENTDTQLGELSTTVSDMNKKLTEKDTSLETSIDDNKKALQKEIDTLTEKLDEVDSRETSDVQNLTIGLGQATQDIAANKQSITNLESGVEDVNGAVLKLEDKVDTLQTDYNKIQSRVSVLESDVTGVQQEIKTVEQDIKTTQGNVSDAQADIKTLQGDVTGLKSDKQDKLTSGTNINTVLGVSLLDVRDGGITLSDAKDFTSVMKSHLAAGSGVTIEQSSDGQTLTFSATSSGGSTDGLGTSLTVKKTTTTKANQEVEVRPKLRPTSYNLRTYAFKSATLAAQGDLTVKFDTNPRNSLTSPYDNSGKRINFSPDATTARWSSIKTLSIDASVRSSTAVAFSTDGVNWYSYEKSTQTWTELGELSLTSASAARVLDMGITLKDFSALDVSVIQNWINSQSGTAFNIAFAASGLLDDSHVFVPASMTATFNPITSWVRQAATAVTTTITPDSIIFKPSAAGDYVFCYEVQK